MGSIKHEGSMSLLFVEEMKVRGMWMRPGAPGSLNLPAPYLLGQGPAVPDRDLKECLRTQLPPTLPELSSEFKKNSC